MPSYFNMQEGGEGKERGVVERIGVLKGILLSSLFEGLSHGLYPLADIWCF